MKIDVKKLAAFFLAITMCLNGISNFVISKAEDSQKVNVALASNGTTAFTDSPNAWGEDNSYGIEKMIDGDTTTLGMADAKGVETNVENIILGFKKAYTVDSVILYKYANGGFPVDFTLSAYTQEGWQEVVKKENYESAKGANTINFMSAVDCSAIRLTVTKNSVSTNEGYQLYLTEIEVYGVEATVNIPTDFCIKNVAEATNGATITTDRYDAWTDGNGSAYHISKMIDGKVNENTYGITKANEENQTTNIDVTFNGIWHIDTVRLYKANDGGFPVDFTIQVFSEEEWKTVHTETNYTTSGNANTFTFEGINCTAVRINVTKNGLHKNGNQYNLYLAEIEAWGKEASVNVARNEGTVFTTSHLDNWTVTSDTGKRYGLSNLNDGSVGDNDPYYFITASSADYENIDMQVCASLDKTYRIDRIRVYKSVAGGFPVDFAISVYTQTGWKTVLTKTGYESVSGWNSFEFEAIDCSAVRLTATKHGITTANTYAIYLQEFEIYGLESENTISVPHTTANVALNTNNATPSTSHLNSWAEGKGYGLKNLNDGDTGTADLFMTAMSSDYQTEKLDVDINFSGAYQVNEVKLYAHNEDTFPIDFTISAYTENGWETVVTKENYNSVKGCNTFWFDDVNCTAIRLTSTENGYNAGSSAYGIYLSEFEVYGIESTVDFPTENTPVNVALATSGTTVTTNHVNEWAEKNEYGIVNINDNDTESLFMTAMDASYENLEMNVTFNFNNTYCVNGVNMYAATAGAFPVDFRLEAYTADGWSTVLTKESYESISGVNTFTFNDVNCSALRLVSTKNGVSKDGNYGIYLNEIEIFGVEATTEVPVRRNLSAGAVVFGGGANNEVLTDNIVATEDFYTSKLVGSADDSVSVHFFFEASNDVDCIRLYAHEVGKLPGSLAVYAFTGTQWEKIVDYNVDTSLKTHEISFAKVSCSSVILVATDLYQIDDGFGMELDEVWVYGAQIPGKCGLLGDGNGDTCLTEAEDLASMRTHLVTTDVLNGILDINHDDANSVIDLIRMKRYFAESQGLQDCGYDGTSESITWNRLLAYE